MSAASDVRSASDALYAALNRMGNGVQGTMEDVWSHGTQVTAMHPIGGRTEGWEAVRQSFDQVAGLAANAKIGIRDQQIHVHGDMAYELGVEFGTLTMAGHDVVLEHRVTNIYAREAGGWKLVHHHTDLSPAMLDVLKRL
jgi:ketosteroid isomerase-like protein